MLTITESGLDHLPVEPRSMTFATTSRTGPRRRT